MNNRKSILSLDNFITGSLLLLIFLFLNLSVSESTIATDFTGSGYYTLQQPTINLLRGSDDLLKIKYHITPNLMPRTPEYIDLKQKVTGLLRLYDQYGGANVRLEVSDPTDGSRRGIPKQVRNRLEREGVVPAVKKIQRKGGSSEFTFYSSIEITYRDNDRVINKVTDVDNLEYTLSQEIQYAMNPELVKIGMYVPPRMTPSPRRRRGPRGGGGPQRQEDSRSFSALEQKLNEIGIVERIFLEEGDYFPDPRKEDSLDVLLVLANRTIPESDLYALDQYLMRGGKTIIAADPVGMKPSRRRSPMSRGGGERQGFLYSDRSSGKTLLDLLEQYGVKGSSAVTIDRSEAEAQVPVRREKTITYRGQTRRVQMQEMVWSELPFLYRAQPSRAGNRPAFVDRVGDPIVLFPMSLRKSTKEGKGTYVPWFTTGPFGTELPAPTAPGPGGRALGEFVNSAIEFNFLRDGSTGNGGDEKKNGKKKAATKPGMKQRDLVVSFTSTFSSAFPHEQEIPEAMKPGSSEDEGEKQKQAGEADAKESGNESSGNEDAGKEKAAEKQNNGELQAEQQANGKKTESEESQKKPGERPEHISKSPEIELVVAGDTDLFEISMMDRYRGRLFGERSPQSPNETFATGLINYLTRSKDQELNIQPERIVTPRLAALSPVQKTIYEVLLIGLAPLLVILFGLIRWGLVRSGREQVKVEQQQT